jgi:hypothetical protein
MKNGSSDTDRHCSNDLTQMYAVGKFVTRPSGKQASKEVFAQNKRAVRKRKDGSVVHAVSVSIFCFKLGRLSEFLQLYEMNNRLVTRF